MESRLTMRKQKHSRDIGAYKFIEKEGKDLSRKHSTGNDIDNEHHSGILSPNAVASLHLSCLSEQYTPRSSSQGTPARWGTSSFSSHIQLDPSAITPINIVTRLQSLPLTGQVVAWAWNLAAEMAQNSRRAPPVALLAALWPATASVVDLCCPQDLIEIVQSWLVLLQKWPKHFVISSQIVRELIDRAFPSNLKRMSEERIKLLAKAITDIAILILDPMDTSVVRATNANARELVQPIFALILSEMTWRSLDPTVDISASSLTLCINSSNAWSWKIAAKDDTATAIMKNSCQACLEVLRTELVSKES